LHHSARCMASLLCFLPAMLFEKYRARKAATKELKAQADVLEKEYERLRNPMPPAYDEIVAGPSADGSTINANKPVDPTSQPVGQDSARGRPPEQDVVR